MPINPSTGQTRNVPRLAVAVAVAVDLLRCMRRNCNYQIKQRQLEKQIWRKLKVENAKHTNSLYVCMSGVCVHVCVYVYVACNIIKLLTEVDLRRARVTGA